MRIQNIKNSLITLATISTYTAGVISFTTFAVRTGFFRNTIIPYLDSNIGVPVNYVKSLFTKLPNNLVINVPFYNMKKLIDRGDELVKNNTSLFSTEKDWEKIELKYLDSAYSAKIRLKGIKNDHRNKDGLWSYKIKLNEGNTVFGMNRFSIMHPRTRGYMNDWYFHQMNKYLGIIVPKYTFRPISLNGKQYPIYIFQENYSKHLIERNERREGPIFMLMNRANKYAPKVQEISFYNKKYFLNNEEGKLLIRRAERLIKGFYSGELMPHEVFDIDLWAKAFAISDVFGWSHAVNVENVRLYLNPITGLIEPIPTDMTVIKNLNKNGLIGEKYSHFGNSKLSKLEEINFTRSTYSFIDPKAKLFSDPKFSEAYIRALSVISKDNWLPNFFKSIKEIESYNLSILKRDYPWYSFKNKQIFYDNVQYIKSRLNPKEALQVFISNKDNEDLQIFGTNFHTLPLEILAIKDNKGNNVYTFKKNIFLPNMKKICLDKNCLSALRANSIYRNLELELDYNKLKYFGLNDLNIEYRLVGNSKKILSPLYSQNEFLKNKVDSIKYLQSQNFIDNEEISKKRIVFKSGYLNIEQNIIIPFGYNLIINSGTTINLINNSFILSYSPINFTGTDDFPVVIKSSDYSGQGLSVIGVKGKSNLNNVVFENIRSLKKDGLTFTGSITFYDADVEINNLIFRSNQAEDALNLINSDFNISNSKFINIFSDAIDADFSNGYISKTEFLDIGNDGIDISGSKVQINNIKMQNILDKGISIGEKSESKINEVKIDNSKIGIANKDSSFLDGKNIMISNSQVGLATYQKKSEFGPSSMDIEKLKLYNSYQPFLIEDGSFVKIDNFVKEPNAKNVFNSLYSSD